MDDLAHFCCQKHDCPLYGRRNAGNLSVCARYATQNHIRLLSCNACKYRSSERKGTPLFHTHLPEEKARSVLHHLSEGCGVRRTGPPGRRPPQLYATVRKQREKDRVVAVHREVVPGNQRAVDRAWTAR